MNIRFTKTLNSSLNVLPLLAQEIEAWGDIHHIDMKTIFQVNLILEELITNIICYGHQQQPEKKIELVLQQDKTNQLVITLIDEAPAFNPLLQDAASIDTEIGERPIGGLGIHFVRSLTDQIDYSYTGRGNRLTLYKSMQNGC